MYEILRTDKADEDLRGVIFYIVDDSGSTETALSYLDKIEKGIKNFSQFPYIGVVPKYKILKIQNYRVLIVEKHLVFYKLNETNKTIIIYRVLSSKQEYINLL